MQTAQTAHISALPTGVLNVLRRYPLISFFVIAYAISWTYVLVVLVAWPLPDTIVTDTPELFGPVVAGFVMAAVMSGKVGVRQLLRRLVLWRVRLVWYAVAVLGMPAIYFISIAVLPGAVPSFKAPTLTMALLYPVFFLVVMILDGPLLEEPGWRGFALPRLQDRWGPLVGTVILGILWASWHAPQYLTSTFSAANGGLSVSGVSVFLIGAVSFSVIITWVFNHTRGSLLLAILIHTVINYSQALSSDLFPKAAYNEVAPVIGYAAFALVVVVATRGRLGLGPATRAAGSRIGGWK
jgi:membrane protease YdiL (CAAX protease family)